MTADRPSFVRSNYSGYLLVDPAGLLDALESEDGIVPAWPHVEAEHVTYAYPDADPAPVVEEVVVVGYVRGEGVDCVVIEVDGTSDRPDGGTFHITLSVAPGHRPVESNAAIAAAPLIPVGPHRLAVTAF